MDTTEYNTLLTALAAVPAPRHARGQRHAWQHLLVIIAALVTSPIRPRYYAVGPVPCVSPARCPATPAPPAE